MGDRGSGSKLFPLKVFKRAVESNVGKLDSLDDDEMQIVAGAAAALKLQEEFSVEAIRSQGQE